MDAMVAGVLAVFATVSRARWIRDVQIAHEHSVQYDSESQVLSEKGYGNG